MVSQKQFLNKKNIICKNTIGRCNNIVYFRFWLFHFLDFYSNKWNCIVVNFQKRLYAYNWKGSNELRSQTFFLEVLRNQKTTAQPKNDLPRNNHSFRFLFQ